MLKEACMVVWERPSLDGFRRHLPARSPACCGDRGLTLRNTSGSWRGPGGGGGLWGFFFEVSWPYRGPPVSSFRKRRTLHALDLEQAAAGPAAPILVRPCRDCWIRFLGRPTLTGQVVALRLRRFFHGRPHELEVTSWWSHLWSALARMLPGGIFLGAVAS